MRNGLAPSARLAVHERPRAQDNTWPRHDARARCASWCGTLFQMCLGVVIVYLTLTVPSIVLYESFLSYLGLGVQPPMAIGVRLFQKAWTRSIDSHHWWMIVFPGGVLVSTLLALNFLGDGLRDAWDVKG